VLRDHLGAGPRPVRAYFRDLARAIDAPWDMSAGGDLGFPGVQGRRTLKVRLGNAFMSRLQVAATRDRDVSRAFMRVAGLVDPPTALTRLPVLSRVLWQARNRGSTASQDDSHSSTRRVQ
jgi:hypothetical protein